MPVLTVIALAVMGGCGGSAPATPGPATPAASAPAASPAPTVHPLVIALANEGTGNGSPEDIARAEAWLVDVAVEQGMTVDYYIDVWDGTDLLSPISPTLEALRQRLPGDALADLCPLEAPIAAGTSGEGRAVIEHAADDLHPFGILVRLQETSSLHRDVEHLAGKVATYVKHQVAVGDASTSISLQPYSPRSPTVEFPADWLASTPDDIARVVCLRTERTDEVLRTCSYGGGRVKVRTMRMATIAEIHDARTAERIETVTIPGPDDSGGECPISVSVAPGTHESDGRLPTAASIVDALAPILGDAG